MSSEERQVKQAGPVVDIEELHKEVRTRRSSSARMLRESKDSSIRSSKDSIRKSSSEIMQLLSTASEGNVVALCTCQQSKDYPYCDNTHMVFNKATNSNLSPLYVAFVEGRKCDECGAGLKRRSLTCSIHEDAPPSQPNDCTHTTAFPEPTTPSHKPSKRPIRKSSSPSTPSSLGSSMDFTPNFDISSQIHTSDSPSPSVIESSSIPSTSSPIPSTQSSLPNSTHFGTSDISTSPSIPNFASTPSPSTTDSPSPSNPNSLPSTPQDSQNFEPDTTTDTTPTSTPTEETIQEPTVTYTPTNIKDPRNRNNIIPKAEVAMHNTQQDLWMIIKGNVYDITNYVKYHPGGTRALVKFAGKDGTENVQYHSSTMLELLNTNYYIGKLPREEGGPGGGCTIS